MLKKTLIKLRKLSKIQNKNLFIQVFFILFFIKLGLNLVHFSRFKSIFEKLEQISNLNNDEETTIISFINIISRNELLKFTCLHQALTLKYFLKNDVTAKIIVGVNKTGGSFEAHAWVARENKILVGDFQNNQFIPIWVWT